MKEIGGFFQLETNSGKEYFPDAIRLNSARNCLKYIIKVYNIQNMWVPLYTCPVVWDAIKEEGCRLDFYDIDIQFRPTRRFPRNDFVLYTNYFGICGKNAEYLSDIYPNLIIDNSQSFYSQERGLASIYSPRKFFGVPDGGYLAMRSAVTMKNLPLDQSLDRVSHLLKRIELGATDAYNAFKSEDAMLDHAPIKGMSNLTRAILQGLDYEEKKEVRLRNFFYLHSELKEYNELSIDVSSDDVPMVYPLLIKDISVKNFLINSKIYVATYWKGQMDKNVGKLFENYLLPLPIDQRYSLEDMHYILSILKEAM